MFRRSRGIVRLEDIQTLELLIQNSEGLKTFCFDHLCLEPVFNFILLDLFQVLVVVIQMSIELQ